MHKTVAALALALLASPAAAQSCYAPIGPIETCLVGAWVGTSDRAQVLERFMNSMPGTTASVSNFGQPEGLIIYEDGFFETMPTSAVLFALTEIGDGDMAQIDANLQTTTAMGWLSGVSGDLQMCHMPGSGSAAGQMTVTTSEGSATGPIGPPPGASGALPPMSYTCAGDSLVIQTHIGPPLGTVTSTLTRVSLDRFPEEFRARIEERFAPAE